MMTIAGLLEEDREAFIRRIEEARTPERAVPKVTEEIDHILLRYNEACTDERCREAAGRILSVLRAAVPLLSVIKETNVYEKAGAEGGGATREQTRKRRWVPSVLLLAAGCVLSLGAILLSGGKGFSTLLSVPVLPVLLILSILAAFLGGYLVKRSPGVRKDRELLTEHVADAEKIYRTLRAAALTADQELKELQAAGARQKQQEEAEAALLPEDELTLLSDLLEASASGDSDYAFERLSDIRYYLHRHHIEVVEYTEDTARWFDPMPSHEKGTLKPALVSEGKLLKKGICGV